MLMRVLLATGLSPALVGRSNPFASHTQEQTRSYNPAPCCQETVWTRPISLATTLGISVDFLAWATEMFQFALSPPPDLWIESGVSRHDSGGVASFGLSRLIAWMPLPLNVSPVSASFLGGVRLGIPLVLI